MYYQFVELYLGQYDIEDTISICDPSWEAFFKFEVSNSPSKHSHLFKFLQDCSKHYTGKRKCCFILDLLKLKVDRLFGEYKHLPMFKKPFIHMIKY